jgi:hypothetical protein
MVKIKSNIVKLTFYFLQVGYVCDVLVWGSLEVISTHISPVYDEMAMNTKISSLVFLY